NATRMILDGRSSMTPPALPRGGAAFDRGRRVTGGAKRPVGRFAGRSRGGVTGGAYVLLGEADDGLARLAAFTSCVQQGGSSTSTCSATTVWPRAKQNTTACRVESADCIESA